METILEVKDLSKKYKNLTAVDSLSLSVERSMIYGILGPNGSGKTTTLGMLLGILHPSGGTFSWFGNGNQDENRKRIGSLLETPNFYPYLSAVQNLKISSEIKGISNVDSEIERVLKRVDLWERKDSKFSTFSLGMKQRLAIGATLLGDPEILVLDEPTNGLDPQGIAEIRDLIKDIGNNGKTIIIASHILDEVEKVCTHCAILRKGELLQTGPIADIIGNQDVALFKIAAENKVNLEKVISKISDISIYKEEEDVIIIRVAKSTKASSINEMFFKEGVTLTHLALFKESLENQFLEIIKNS